MKSQIARFGSVGLINTAVDFLIFAFLTSIVGLHYVAANTISTGSALGLSYFLNGKLTFRSRLNGKNAALFVSTTLVGLWVLQPIVITLFEPLLSPIVSGAAIKDAGLLASKVVATGFSLLWNFVMYKYVVFPAIDTRTDR